eukprot:augustus_masked-scaffold_72-processed-gene-0.11-mRNA-1 protein AED:0.47 eAED:0.47 QI:0/-1/0/1/-1/1/1/0/602
MSFSSRHTGTLRRPNSVHQGSASLNRRLKSNSYSSTLGNTTASQASYVSQTLRRFSLSLLHPSLAAFRDRFSDVHVIKLNQGELSVSFSLVKNTAQGASASIFKSYQENSLIPCAVKRIHAKAFNGHEEELENLLNREKTTLEKLSLDKDKRSFFVTKFLGFYEYAKLNEYWIIQEYCDCGSLLDFITYCNKKGTYLTYKQIASIIGGVLAGLEYMHDSGYIHSDLKTANILIASPGLVKLCDFGLSTKFRAKKSKFHLKGKYKKQKKKNEVEDEALYELHALSTVDTMAPEMIRKSLALDEGDPGAEKWVYDTKVDIWAVGVITLEMLILNPPMYFFRKENEDNFSWYLANMLKNLRINNMDPFDTDDTDWLSVDSESDEFYRKYNSGLYYFFNKDINFLEAFSSQLIRYDKGEGSEKEKLRRRINKEVKGKKELDLEGLDELIEEFSFFENKPMFDKFTLKRQNSGWNTPDVKFANKNRSSFKDYATFSRPLRSTLNRKVSRNLFEVKKLLSFIGTCLLIDKDWRPSAIEAGRHPFVKAQTKEWNKLCLNGNLEDIVKFSKKRGERSKIFKEMPISSTVKPLNQLVQNKVKFDREKALLG